MANNNSQAYQVRISLSAAIGKPGRKASARKVKTYTVRVEGSEVAGWSQTSVELAIADFKRQTREAAKR